jgi:hypothetical protein
LYGYVLQSKKALEVGGIAQNPRRRAAEFCGGENIMMIVLAYFVIAAAAVIAASAIIGFFLTTLLIRFLQNVDRSIRLCRGKVPAFSAPHGLLRKLLSLENLA